eukprot:5711981-Pyramimonas_sp.AAC.1
MAPPIAGLPPGYQMGAALTAAALVDARRASGWSELFSSGFGEVCPDVVLDDGTPELSEEEPPAGDRAVGALEVGGSRSGAVSTVKVTKALRLAPRER